MPGSAHPAAGKVRVGCGRGEGPIGLAAVRVGLPARRGRSSHRAVHLPDMRERDRSWCRLPQPWHRHRCSPRRLVKTLTMACVRSGRVAPGHGHILERPVDRPGPRRSSARSLRSIAASSVPRSYTNHAACRARTAVDSGTRCGSVHSSVRVGYMELTRSQNMVHDRSSTTELPGAPDLS